MAQLVEHIVHIDGVTGLSPVATTREPNRKVRLVLYIEEMDTENRPRVLQTSGNPFPAHFEHVGVIKTEIRRLK